MGIHKDLAKGKEGEVRVATYFESLGIITELNPSKKRAELSKWDMKSTWGKLEFTSEVKNDLYAARTGNIAIEVYNPKSDKPSGVYITEAHIWCHITHGKLYFTSVAKLREYIESIKPLKTIERAGDGNAKILLYKVDSIMPDLFLVLEELSVTKAKKQLKGLINEYKV
jgi:hypothetical protein